MKMAQFSKQDLEKEEKNIKRVRVIQQYIMRLVFMAHARIAKKFFDD